MKNSDPQTYLAAEMKPEVPHLIVISLNVYQRIEFLLIFWRPNKANLLFHDTKIQYMAPPTADNILLASGELKLSGYFNCLRYWAEILQADFSTTSICPEKKNH